MKDLKRTKKDEDDYNLGLRRESPIKTEVIQELRAQLRLGLENQERLLTSLIESEETLLLYRRKALDNVRACMNHEGHCAIGCTRHAWDTVAGWHRTGEAGR